MLKGKSAVVTGSTSGIGLGIARALAAEGASIMLNGFGNPAAIETLRESLAHEFGVTVLFNGADLSKGEHCAALIRDAETRLGGCDILINNAGIQYVAPVEEFPVERWDAVIALNLSASFHTIRTALPGMKTKGWGRIVNMASVHGLCASVNKIAYISAKHGIVGMTKAMALETAGLGITCNAICPGWVKTPLVEAQILARATAHGVSEDQAMRDMLSERQPSKTFTTTEQIGGLAVFLCSSAADNMTGTALPIDGGWMAL
ncbi:D-beta-hydroxybutyrate dehydrogenase [Candidatus Terasakiella magnetica]|nr:D-beta-hydroxybutyrate dehydrogenase [Candidatus Terasakiella magnetica]